MTEQQRSRGLCAEFEGTNPELARIVSAFMDEVQHEEAVQLPARTRGLCVAATLLGCQGIDAFRAELPGILDAGVTPVELREVVYQAVDYVGIGRALPFVNALDEVLAERGVELPLEAQGTVVAGDRLQKGNQAQVDIFGEGMRGVWETCPSERAVVNRWLAANCFGDYYTRKVLDVKERELITFTAIVTLGGCDPQAKAHAAANISVGNSRQDLLDALTIALPYIGYPRTLNGLSCVNAVAPSK